MPRGSPAATPRPPRVSPRRRFPPHELPGLTLADALVRAQMLEDPGCAPKPQHVLTLAPPGCEETSHSGSESGSGGSGPGRGQTREKRRRSTLSLATTPTRRRLHRNVASSDPPTRSTPVVGTVGTPSAPQREPPHPAARTSSRSPARSSSAASSPRRWRPVSPESSSPRRRASWSWRTRAGGSFRGAEGCRRRRGGGTRFV